MKKIKFSILLLIFGTLVSKVLGLIREMFLAEKFGAGYISDAFILAISIPTILITSFAAALNTNYIPIISEIEKDNKKDVKKFNGILLNSIFIICTILVVLFFIFSKQIVKVFALGYDDEGLKYIVTLTRISIISVYFILMQYVFQGFLEYKESFRGTALSGILLNVGFIFGLFFSSTENYYILGYGILLAYVLSFLYVLILAIRKKFDISINWNFKNKYLKKMVVLTIPLLLNSALWEINGLIDKSISSTIGEGYISALNYANFIVTMVSAVFATSIATVSFPKFVKMINDGKKLELNYEVKKVLKYILIIAIPCTSLLVIYSNDIVKTLFFRGEFSNFALEITSMSVKLYSLGILFTCLQIIIFKVFYAFQDTKTPTKTAIISILLNIILNVVLSKIIGYKGIIFATVISTVISVILLLYELNKKQNGVLDKSMLKDSLKIILANIIFFALLYVLYIFFPHFYIINDVITCVTRDVIIFIIASLVYLIMVFNKIIKFNLKI